MPDANQHEDLVERFRRGDPQAAQALFDRYAVRLARLADQHLSRKVAGRLDGEDVVQSVFRTFFRRCSRGEFQLDTSAQVWQLLVTLTLRKSWAEGRRHRAGKRDAGLELPGADFAGLAEAVSREPGPAEAAGLVDQIGALLRGLPDLYCHVLERRLEGHAVADIAAELAVSRQTVYRALELLQHRLARLVRGPA
jgi:DNA-directed RNA polymerase specialized sigma24 family protein